MPLSKKHYVKLANVLGDVCAAHCGKGEEYVNAAMLYAISKIADVLHDDNRNFNRSLFYGRIRERVRETRETMT